MARTHELWQRLRASRAGRWVLGVTVVSVVVRWVGDALFNDFVSTHVEPRVAAAVKWLLVQPVGLVLLLCAFWFIALSSWMAYDGSEWAMRRRQIDRHRRPLSESERKLIQDLRTVWTRYGEMPVGAIAELLRRAVGDLKERVYWGELLTHKVEQLTSARDALKESLGSGSVHGIEQVRDRFDAMYRAYLQGCCWIARLNEARDIDTSAEPGERYMTQWRAGHREFFDKLQDLVTIPEHEQTLSIYPGHYSETAAYLAKLLAEPTPPTTDSVMPR